MQESEKNLNDIELRKEKIRQRYKGIDRDELEVIPALPVEDFFDETKVKRVAVYARVSTDDPNQTSSYELQRNHYADVVNRRDNWELVKIYADEGISGTSLQHRDAFIEMINDCKAGKIDLIVTKSVSRFARNVIDCVGYVRELSAMNPPVEVFFETENLHTFSKNSEMALSFMSTLAQEESHNKSEIMNASIEMRFSRGIFLTPPLLGYDRDEDGNLIINEEEAKTVRLIFFMYLYGYSCQEIADTLESLERKTKKGRIKWSVSTVQGVLKNERHCGDVLARKTFTPNYLNHKSKPNRQDRNQYRKADHHEAIISRDDFIAVQRLLSNSSSGGKNFLPELHALDSGALKGFITLNPYWAGFKKETYMKAYKAAFPRGVDVADSTVLTPADGEFDLRGYQVVQGQYFAPQDYPVIKLSYKYASFNKVSLHNLKDSTMVELLIEPSRQLVAVRPTTKDNRHAVRWLSTNAAGIYSRKINLSACMPALYELFDWNPEYSYQIAGTQVNYQDYSILLFNIKNAEAFIPAELFDEDNTEGFLYSNKKSVHGFPYDGTNEFGANYYERSKADEISNYKGRNPKLDNPGKIIPLEDAIHIRTHEEIGQCVDEVMNEIRNEDMNDNE